MNSTNQTHRSIELAMEYIHISGWSGRAVDRIVASHDGEPLFTALWEYIKVQEAKEPPEIEILQKFYRSPY